MLNINAIIVVAVTFVVLFKFIVNIVENLYAFILN